MGVEKLGSVELRESLPHGVLKKMSEVFGHSAQTYVGRIVSGKQSGNPLMIECAERIVDAYEESGFEEKLEEILKDYAGAN